MPRGRQAILGSFLVQPERRWYLSDLAHHLHVQPSSLQRELASLTSAGILRRDPDGNRVYYQANPAFPLFPELQRIFVKTAGLADQVRWTLAPFFERIDFAFIYGSIARGERTGNSDVDLIVVGSVGLADPSMPLRELERALGVPVNVTVYAAAEFAGKWKQENHFLRTIAREQKIFMKGSEHELANTFGGPEDQGSHDEQARA
nr:Nucleotidyltransferase domain protein [uncultured bacterium]